MEYPIKLKHYLYGPKFWETDTPYELEDRGVDKELLEKISYLVYELELDLEIHENGVVHITHVGGQQLDKPITDT